MSFITSLDTSVNKAMDLLSVSIFAGDMYILANDIRGRIRPIAVTILGLCFVIEFLKIITHEDILKWQTGLKVGAKLVLTYVTLDISSQVLEAIYATGADLMSMVNNSNMAIGTLVKDNLRTSIEKLTLMQALGMVVTLGVAFLIVWFVGILVLVIAYGRSIELLLHIAIAPIPCAFLMLEGHNASRMFWKFLMSFAANCLQGFFIVLSIALYEKLVLQIFETAVADGADLAAITGGLLLGVVVLVVMVFKSGSIAKQILDV